ncbi:MAG TPA: protein translocase subunit SecF [Cyanobacteria bacterium UBA10660]|nr:MAG TPA: protein translocase subunit SecF [Candidatus Gastranaerophilales bacterium HUM_1]HAS93527.1 protein translocase subunit SecF [Cyanobacteria bacterium UBA10660]
MFNFKKNGVHVVKYRVLWMCLSALLLIPGIIAMIYSMITYPTHSPMKVGIDYTGGTILQYGVPEAVSSDDLAKTREDLDNIGVTNTYLQVLNVNPTAENNNIKSIISIRTKFIDEGSDLSNQISTTIKKEYKNAELVQVSSVGPTLGNELFKMSIIALLLAIVGMIVYISFRFKLEYAIAAILGLVHDVLFVMGVFSILGIFCNVQIDGLFLTAILTLIGFSINDTIVTFDRIRENLRYYGKKMTFGEIVDASVNQTLTRSVNTSLTAFITLAALYFFGGVTTKDFVLAMMIGVVVGTYSSIFFCSMLVDFWEEKKGQPKHMAVEG